MALRANQREVKLEEREVRGALGYYFKRQHSPFNVGEKIVEASTRIGADGVVEVVFLVETTNDED